VRVGLAVVADGAVGVVGDEVGASPPEAVAGLGVDGQGPFGVVMARSGLPWLSWIAARTVRAWPSRRRYPP
jgi:hypothetical protein